MNGLSHFMIFLDEPTRAACRTAFLDRPDIPSKEVIAEDHLGETFPSLELWLGLVPLNFHPANHFHYHRDFEIAVVCPTDEDWNTTTAALSTQGPCEIGKMDTTGYAIPQTPGLHGPFFFLHSETETVTEDLLRFRADLSRFDLDFYNNHFRPLVGMVLTDRLEFDHHPSDRLCLRELVVRVPEAFVFGDFRSPELTVIHDAAQRTLTLAFPES